MQLYFLSTRDVRKNRADCVHFMRCCHEFSKNDFLVKLITPFKIRFEYYKKKSEIWSLYNLNPSFEIIELKTLLFDNMPRFLSNFVRFQKITFFGMFFLKELILGRLKKDKSVIYSVCYYALFPVLILKKLGILKVKIFFEKADIKTAWLHRFTMKNVDGIIAINNFLKEKSIKLYDLDENKIIKRDFPSMSEDIQNIENKSISELRKNLGIHSSDSIVVYAGKISPVLPENHFILESAKFLPNIKFLFVGIRDISKKYFSDYLLQHNLKNVIFIPFQPFNQFVKYIKIADVLVSYYDANEYYSVTQRVPAKLTLYLTAKKPIIVADLPSLREWFDDQMVYFVEPNKPEALAQKIEYAMTHPEESRDKALNCQEFAKAHTYEKAYREVSNFIKKIISS